MSSSKGTALITGASAGIGAVYADRLARRGYDLILVARNEKRLDALASRLRLDTGRKVDVLIADLGKPSGIEAVTKRLREDAAITLLLNNAGAGAVTPLASSDINKMQEIVTLNVRAVVTLTYAVVPGFVARGSGTIINISSVTAIAPERLNGVYGGSKAFVLAFSQSLRHELSDKGIRVQVVLPGATATELWDNSGYPLANLAKEIVMSTEDMVDAALAGLDQGEFATLPALPDIADWNAYEAARQRLMPNLSRSEPAARYLVAPKAA